MPERMTRDAKKQRTNLLVGAGLVLALGVLAPACSVAGGLRGGDSRQSPARLSAEADTTPPASQPAAPTQTSEAGQAVIAVTWKGLRGGPVFGVVMDTHSVDLDGYDLRQLALLRTDEGKEARPDGWDAAKGGHHRSGTLTFPSIGSDGGPLMGPTTRGVELIIREVAGVPERTFRWTL